jgi:cytochrome b6-f complex iron-sulfur subunit
MAKRKVKKKPESKPEDEPKSAPSSRRSFLLKLWFGLGFVVVFEYVWVLLSFLRPRKSSANEGDAVVIAGPVEQFDKGSVTAFQSGRFYLARLDDGGFLALYRECTHLGCTVPWVDEEKRFVCPCHASAYDIRGDVLSPPAPRALDRYAVRIENGIVKVDTSRAISRPSFDTSQVVHP